MDPVPNSTEYATAKAGVSLTTEPLGDNVLLRLDKAVYKTGEAMKMDVRSSAGLPTVYVDVVRAGQTVLTKWLDVKDGKDVLRLTHPRQNQFATFSADDHYLVSTSSGGLVHVWDTATGREVDLPLRCAR